MRLLVTGGAGFIGSNFVRFWANRHPIDQITVLDKLTYAGHAENLKPLADSISFIRGDIADIEDVIPAVENQDVVVNFAAESHVDRSIISPDAFLRTNIFGTYTLLEALRRSEIKLLHHVSTDEVFGSLRLNEQHTKFNELTRYDPNSPYAAAKASSDHLVRAYHHAYGLPVTISNTSNNYGPWQDPEKLIPRFITNLIEEKPVPLMGQGENVRDWCYVEDHCIAIDLIIQRALLDSAIIGETYCVGGNSERSNAQVTLELLRLFGKDTSWITRMEHRLGHDERYAIDTSKMREVFGWQPQRTFEEWLEKTVMWYKDNSWWWKPLKEGRPIVDPEVQGLLRSKER